jgi:hypothetical protein
MPFADNKFENVKETLNRDIQSSNLDPYQFKLF